MTYFRNKYTQMELEVLDQLIPLTRKLDLSTLEWAQMEQDELVLKPAIGNGGRNVSFGRSCTKDEWVALLSQASHSGEMYVLQRFQIPEEIDMPVPGGIGKFHLSVGGIGFGNQFAGGFLRFQPSGGYEAINCTRGSTFSSMYALR